MALQHSHTLDSGITCAEAYTRIQHITHGHGETTLTAQTWADAAARQAEKPTIRTQAYTIPWADSVSLTSAYNALKALDEFQGSLDV